jgi:hypothetical protein
MAQLFTSLEGVNLRNTWLTIGSFDGVHIGHQKLISELNHQAHQAKAKSVVLTFHPHPSVVLRGRTGAFYLTTVPEKTGFLEDLGADNIVITHLLTKSHNRCRRICCTCDNHLDSPIVGWEGFALGRAGRKCILSSAWAELNYRFM